MLDNNEVLTKLDELECLFNELSEWLRRSDKYEFERWSAGGRLIDNDIISMYPTLRTSVENVIPIEEVDEFVLSN